MEEAWVLILAGALIGHLTSSKVKLRALDCITVLSWLIRAPRQGSETLTCPLARAVLLLSLLYTGISYEIHLKETFSLLINTV